MTFRILDRDDPARACTETMIRSVYDERYGARILEFPDRIAALFSRDGKPLCAAGLRDARSGFFSEIYLNHPVDVTIAGLALEPVARETILEVTTLAAVKPGISFRMIGEIVADGRDRGMRWGVFTATRPLRHGLLRAGAGLIELARADRRRLGPADSWGRYYETDPFVCAVSGHIGIGRTIGRNATCSLPPGACAHA